jgi:ABC-type lipoprotein export system ATPase subunit
MTDNSSAILSARDLRKEFRSGDGTVKAVDGVSLDLDAGDFVTLHGPSGCGKSTLLLMAGALLSPDDGELQIGGENPYDLGAEARAGFRARHIGFVFQQFHLIPFLDVLDNVRVCELAGGDGGVEERARELLDVFGLSDRLAHVPSMLSVGEQQRVALARALVQQPKLLLADEPTGNLDSDNAEILLGHLANFADKGGAVLMVTHDDRAKAAAKRSVEVKDGKIVG